MKNSIEKNKRKLENKLGQEMLRLVAIMEDGKDVPGDVIM